MKIHPVKERADALVAVLTDIWEASVRATHTFLTEADIAALREYVPDALCAVEHLTVLLDDSGRPVGFCAGNAVPPPGHDRQGCGPAARAARL